MPAHEDTTAPGNETRCDADEAGRKTDGARREEAGAEPRELLLMRAGQLAFAVYAEEVETVTPWSKPAPLPHAPPAVLGVIAARGRMRTVLDPLQLLSEAGGTEADGSASPAPAYDFVSCLRGDEQLAVAFESAARAHLDPNELLTHDATDGLPARGLLVRGGETVFLLDPAKIFAAAMRGTERRRARRAR
jgi:chemotaxis signal transduction protein